MDGWKNIGIWRYMWSILIKSSICGLDRSCEGDGDLVVVRFVVYGWRFGFLGLVLFFEGGGGFLVLVIELGWFSFFCGFLVDFS